MSNKSPVFPMLEPHHFSDYGFDPQIDYFQFLEEARKHKRETSMKPIDSLHFTLQKPISKDETARKTHKTSKKKRWWRSALLFFKWKWVHTNPYKDFGREDVHKARAKAFRASISGPVYITDSRSDSTTPYRTTALPSSGPLAGTMAPARKSAMDIPYVSLRELNLEQQQVQRKSMSAMPVYLVS